MQSAVERILNENFNTDSHTLSFSTPVIELSVNEGTTYEGSFDILGPVDEYVEGFVSTTNMRMNLPVSEFSGSNVTVPFSFDTIGLSDGDSFKGDFRIISNKGEYLLPFEIRIGNEELDTSLGNIRNMFHFTNLARTNWDEAVDIFASKDFEKILNGAEKQYLEVYRSLADGKDKNQCLEEFLLYIKKKQLASFIVEDPEVKFENILKDMVKDVVIRRNGWGYSSLEVSTDADFIVLEKNRVEDSDFEENLCRLNYSIVESELHEGKNFATISFKNAYQDFKVSVVAIKHPINRKIADMSKNSKHLILDLMHYYEAFRTRKITPATWMNETGKIVEELKSLNPDDPVYELMNVQLLITQDRHNEARWILEQNENRVAKSGDNSLYCYFYYLTTLLNRSDEHTNQVTEMVEKIYLENRNQWRLAWLLLYLEEEYTTNPEKRWRILEEQFRQGAASPVLYVEAYQVLANNPTIINRLGDFETQVLNYMAKKDILTADVIEQLIHILSRQKNYDLKLLPLLKACYKELPSDEVLQAICSLLINANVTSHESHEWYKKGVERMIRITKLYEYFMNSMDLDTTIEVPKQVLMYFAFDSSLDIRRNSFLYCYVYRNKALFPDLYESYKEAIERFVCFQLLNGRNNKYLAILYRNIVTPIMITEDIAKGLSKALFTHVVSTSRDNIARIIIRYPAITEEYSFKMSGADELYIPLYGSEYQLVLEDEMGNRFIRSDEYDIDRLMLPDKLAQTLPELVKEDILFDLWVCEKGKNLDGISAANVECMKRVAEHPLVIPSIRKSIKAGLLSYYYDEDKMDALDDLLDNLSVDEVEGRAIAEVIQYMVIRGKYEKAYEWISLCGGENVDPKVIVKLCSRLLSLDDFNDSEGEDPIMTGLSYRAFVYGKYDERLLNYLLKYFKGASKEMKEIWKVAKEWGLDVYDLERRLLEQMLYSNAFVAGAATIFQDFAQKSTDRKMILAFLAQKCYDYFVSDNVASSEYADILQKCIDYEYEIPMVCKLAYTKFYATRVRDVDEKISRTLVVFLREIVSKGMYFPYFKEYVHAITYMHRFLDKTMIEYRVKEGCSATIHYMIEKNQDSKEEYVTEEMKDMFGGICVKQFVLFFGERLQYYIVEHEGDEERLTESGTISCNDMDERDQNSKYSIINDIAISRTLGDYGTMDKLLSEYYQNEYLIDRLFKMAD